MDRNKFFHTDILQEFKNVIGFQNIYSKEQLGSSFSQDYLPLSLCSTKEKPETINELKNKVENSTHYIKVIVRNIFRGQEFFNKGIIVGYNVRERNFSVKYLNLELDPTKVSVLDRYSYGPFPANFEDIYYDTDYLRNYLIETLNNTVSIIDFIVITDNTRNICGILAVQKGECPDHPESWTVRIICNLNKAECKGHVLKLMGAYMYILKRTNIQEYGILELADGFDNLNGYCTYTKFGFVQNPKFGCSPPFVKGYYTSTGIYISGNLKMLSTVSNISLEQIISVSNSGTNFPIPRPLICDRSAFGVEEEQERYAAILQEDYDREERDTSTGFFDNTPMYLKYNAHERTNAELRLYPKRIPVSPYTLADESSGDEEDSEIEMTYTADHPPIPPPIPPSITGPIEPYHLVTDDDDDDDVMMTDGRNRRRSKKQSKRRSLRRSKKQSKRRSVRRCKKQSKRRSKKQSKRRSKKQSKRRSKRRSKKQSKRRSKSRRSKKRSIRRKSKRISINTGRK
jgi:hypothetical protein